MGKEVDANTEIEILEHNPYWLVVNKPAPLISHPTPRKIEPSLSELMREKVKELGYEADSISLINRLDRETSGVTLIALRKESARLFGKGMVRKGFKKTYHAVAFGHPAEDYYNVKEPILAQNEISPTNIWVRQIIHETGKDCHTEIRCMQRFHHKDIPLSILELHPHTGRMHQLRVHCAFIGHPITGDKLYNKEGDHYLQFIEKGWNTEMERDLILPRQALHASKLSYGEENWLWETPLPRDIRSIIPDEKKINVNSLSPSLTTNISNHYG